MPRRTTVVIQDGTYARLVEESLRRFGSARAISRVIDAMVEQSNLAKGKDIEKNMVRLLRAKKVAKMTIKEIERSRSELSESFENRGS